VPLRRIILNLHLYAGLAAALFLTILGVTGSIMVFEDQIDGWLNPQPAIHPLPERLSLHALQIRLEAANPGYKVAGFGFPPRNDVPFGTFLFSESLKKGMNLAVNPYTGEIIRPPIHRSNFTGKVHQFHRTCCLARRAGRRRLRRRVPVVPVDHRARLVVARKALTVRWAARRQIQLRSAQRRRYLFVDLPCALRDYGNGDSLGGRGSPLDQLRYTFAGR
jgi:hypothetical protein